MFMNTMKLIPLLILVSWSMGCIKKTRKSVQARTSSSNLKSGTVEKTRVSRIVFIDLMKSCKCTRNMIVASWKVIKAALGKKALPIERIHMDTQKSKAELFRSKRPFMVLPAIYFLDKRGEVIKMLQGQVSQRLVEKALQ